MVSIFGCTADARDAQGHENNPRYQENGASSVQGTLKRKR
jgi:hypothetical protein